MASFLFCWKKKQVQYALLSHFRGAQSHICKAVGMDKSEGVFERRKDEGRKMGGKKEKERRKKGRRKGGREETDLYVPNTASLIHIFVIYAMGM